MELGLYGWNKNINFYRSNSTFLTNTAPATPNYGNFNLGDAPFDGITSGTFVGSSSGTQLAINVPTAYGGSLVDAQIAGSSIFKADSTKGVRVSAAIASETQNDAAVYIGVISSTPRIIFGGSTAHEIDNSSGTFRIFRPTVVDFAIDSNGNTAIGSPATPIANTQLIIYSSNAVNTGLLIRGISAQTGDLQQWQNSSTAVLSKVSATGLLSLSGQPTAGLAAVYSYT